MNTRKLRNNMVYYISEISVNKIKDEQYFCY